VVLALAIALSALLAADGDPLPGDLRLTPWVQDLPAFHTVARAFRWGMGTEGVILIGIAAAIALTLARRTTEALVLLLALLLLRLLQPLIKDIVDRPRPAEDLVERRAGFGSESFPSGHLMGAAVLAGMLAIIAWTLPLPRWARLVFSCVLVLLVVANGASSVYLGVHWPSDLLGGLLWALVIVIPAGAVLLVSRTQHRRVTQSPRGSRPCSPT
jgi:undecaprenyl-diphosphatase